VAWCRLNVSNYSEAYAALDACQQPAPLLETLSIHVVNSLEDAPVRPHSSFFAGSVPRLRHCSFASFNFGWTPLFVTDLRVLKLDGYWSASSPSTAVLLDILRTSPRLEEFVLRNLYDVDMDVCASTRVDLEMCARALHAPLAVPAPPDVVVLPALRRLVISAAGAARARALLAQLSAPALEDLELACLDDVSGILSRLEHHALGALPLRRLRIESCSFGVAQLLGVLQRAPALAVLELVDVPDLAPELLKVRV
jgi:hypothetical protein